MTLAELRAAATASYAWRKKDGKTLTDAAYRLALENKEKVKGYQWGPDRDIVRQLVMAERQVNQ